MAPIEASEIATTFKGPFNERLKGEWKGWRETYLSHIKALAETKGGDWLDPALQKRLWESNSITSIGPGSSVTVEGAYKDAGIAAEIRKMVETPLPLDAEERGQRLEGYFEWLLEAVSRYNNRQPRARTRRLLAGLFPRDMTCIVDGPRLRKVAQLVGATSKRGMSTVARHPLLLARLREVLGEPTSLEEQVDQSIFCWFLWERYCDRPEQGAVAIRPPNATDLPSLSLLPVTGQRKGLSYVQQNVNLLVAIVREAEQGISRQDLINVILREAPHLKAAGSASIVISQAQGGLSLIGYGEDAYRPTEHGAELLTASDPREVLQPLLIGRVFGMGQLLLSLLQFPEGRSQRDVVPYLAALSPTRKSAWAGNELIQWALATNLIWRKNFTVGLTEDGVSFANALPPDFLEKWRVVSPIDPVEEIADIRLPPGTDERPEDRLKTAEPLEVRSKFSQGELSSQLIVPATLVLELHAALHSSAHKRFVLLAGLSGTGKTSITRAYAEAYCAALGIPDWRPHYRQVAVRPDWTDPTGLLGFVNSVSDPPSYRPSDTLNFLLQADRDRTRPYFLCLDEMNLARVEHYFAPFLSAMESPASGLRIHGEPDTVDNVDPLLDWPSNLFMFGTVNMDESTHPFSDKVLDRAFTFEFWEVDLEKWEQKWRTSAPDNLLGRVVKVLKDLYDALFPARRHFGYRTADEVLRFCLAAGQETELDALIDAAVLMKVLPRVRGDDSGPLGAALSRVAKICEGMPRSLDRVRHMQDTLTNSGQARFWS